jgi:hypothetical protein
VCCYIQKLRASGICLSCFDLFVSMVCFDLLGCSTASLDTQFAKNTSLCDAVTMVSLNA